ncbi:efflux RND transporter permease subunit [Brevibacillus composti]|uniref:Efflux RND transporter permease subunit n=1 Tax=Brevibacillus composti TaxID=2796470 RepID=A0A7T5EM12_9BACL|nr:efflux RND transporter permease subunit [Brevibacillus composti]QQE75067.1 efflux RND transporter permease subunit [Brevibacillus composti]QUO42153.1 efflux RND transporter permease subunit [Brevibacillus composti]
MKWLTKQSLQNPAMVVIISLLVALGGMFSFSQINIESEPQAKLGMLTISTTYPTASSQDVLEDVTKPLEKAVDRVSGVKSYISRSQENHSLLTVSIEAEANPDRVRDEVEKSVAAARLPASAGRPEVTLRQIGTEPMYFLAISNEKQVRSSEAFYRLVKDKLIRDLEMIEGVDAVEMIGAEKQVIRIRPDRQTLQYYGLSPADLKQAIEAQHVSASVGSVTSEGKEAIARVNNAYSDFEQLRQTRLLLPAGGEGLGASLRLDDVAEIKREGERTSVSRLNGKPAVAVHITKTADGNIVEVSNQIREKLEHYRKEYPDLTFEIVSDRSDFVKTSIGGMAKEGAMGILMAAAVIFLFLRHVKSTLIVLVSIPLCILVSVMFLQWNGISINLMSLFGMTVAIGRVVDDSIVVVENIYRRFQTEPRSNRTIIQAVSEVAGAITSSTLATVAVFLPIAFVSGILGDFFKPFAAAVAWALLASLLVAVTVVPLLAGLTMGRDTDQRHRESRLGLLYPKLLGWALVHKGKTMAIALMLFAGSLGLAFQLPSGFLPELNTNLLFIKLNLPAGTALDRTSEYARLLEEAILREPEVLYVQSKIGSADDAAKATHTTEITVKLTAGTDEDAVLERLRQSIEPLAPADAQIAYSKPAAGGQGGYQAVLYGTDFATLKEAAISVKQKLKENPLLANVKDNVSDRREQLTIQVDRERALQWGLTPDQVSKQVAVAMGTSRLKSMYLDGEEYDLLFGTDHAADLQQLAELWIKSPQGHQVPLTELAALKMEEVQSALLRKDGEPYVQITADILGADKGGISKKQTEALQQMELPAGVNISSEGIQQDMQKGFIEMFAAMGAAVLLVLLVMVASFGNIWSPLAVLLSLPLASIGGMLGLWLIGGVLDMTVLIGFLMLIGIVVTNAIVLMDRVQQLMKAGMRVREALIEAGRVRLRPIMMTAVATIAAMLPLALGFSEGSLLSKGLSTVVIGGLLSSTLLTLVIVPVGYESLHRLASRDRCRKAGKTVHEAIGGGIRDEA